MYNLNYNFYVCSIKVECMADEMRGGCTDGMWGGGCAEGKSSVCCAMRGVGVYFYLILQ